MDTTVTKTVKLANGQNIYFINIYACTKNGFKHSSTMMINNNEYTSETVYYINRTWELYTYQSAMCKCANTKINDIYNRIAKKYLQDHNRKIITKKTKSIIDELCNSDIDYQSYKALENMILYTDIR